MRSTFKVLFYLKRNKEQPLAPVMGRITVNGTIAQFSAKIEVPVRLWEVKGGRAKGKSVEADRINRHLDNIRGQINKHYQDICDHDSYVTAERVRNAYQGFDRKYQTLLEAFEKFTVDYRKRVGVDRARKTWERYCKCSEHLHSFMERVYRVKDMPLLELEQSFIEKFHTYLSHDLGMSPNGLSGYLYTPPQVEREYLTNEELQRLMTTPLRHKCQARTRDMFLFSCFTGICHADMRSLEWKQFEQDAAGNWWVSGNRMKTGTKYLVRLLPVPLSILNKYKGLAGPEKVFPMSTVKVMDRSLKFIAAACGIEKQLSFHFARHTFATTISLMNGVPLIALSKMLGHKSITTTQIYAKVTESMIDQAITTINDKIAGKYSF